MFRLLTPDITHSRRGTRPAWSRSTVVEVVFQYRTLIGKCELGVGLDWDEIEQVTAIESMFEPTSDDRRMKAGRRFRREAIKLTALLRGDRKIGRASCRERV